MQTVQFNWNVIATDGKSSENSVTWDFNNVDPVTATIYNPQLVQIQVPNLDGNGNYISCHTTDPNEIKGLMFDFYTFNSSDNTWQDRGSSDIALTKSFLTLCVDLTTQTNRKRVYVCDRAEQLNQLPSTQRFLQYQLSTADLSEHDYCHFTGSPDGYKYWIIAIPLVGSTIEGNNPRCAYLRITTNGTDGYKLSQHYVTSSIEIEVTGNSNPVPVVTTIHEAGTSQPDLVERVIALEAAVENLQSSVRKLQANYDEIPALVRVLASSIPQNYVAR